MNTMKIRLETPADYRAVEELTREAFWNVYRPGCTEHYVLNRYRGNPDFIPELDFVMEEDGRLIGHVMFSKAELVLPDGGRKSSWTFGPISIHPDYKRRGYGLRLLEHALGKAREMGVGFLCMEGNIDFYRHAGFSLASGFGIHYHDFPKEDAVPFFLAQELIPGWLKANGIEEATYIARPRVILSPTRILRPLNGMRPPFLRKKRCVSRDSCFMTGSWKRAASSSGPGGTATRPHCSNGRRIPMWGPGPAGHRTARSKRAWR